jgi:hypothetical protein
MPHDSVDRAGAFLSPAPPTIARRPNVTADQAIIADSVTTGGARKVAHPALLAAGSEMPMPILNETALPDLVEVGGAEKKI